MYMADVRALVTGGARGMGHAFTQELRDAGAKVVFCDIDAEGVARASEELDVRGFVADVSDEESVSQLFSEVSDALGGVNVLINNAGIIRDGLFMKVDRQTGDVTPFTTSKWQQVIDVNLTGPFFCMRAFTEQAIKAATATGEEPGVLAQRIIEGVRENQLYVLAPEGDPWREACNTRLDDLRAARNPGGAVPGS